MKNVHTLCGVSVLLLVGCGDSGGERQVDGRGQSFRSEVGAHVAKHPNPTTLDQVSADDGIDAHEEMLIVNAYIRRYFPHGSRAIPPGELSPGMWEVQVPGSSSSHLRPMLRVDQQSGFVTATGLPGIALPELQKEPNKAPEPTPGSVTPRATEGAVK